MENNFTTKAGYISIIKEIRALDDAYIDWEFKLRLFPIFEKHIEGFLKTYFVDLKSTVLEDQQIEAVEYCIDDLTCLDGMERALNEIENIFELIERKEIEEERILIETETWLIKDSY